MAVGTAQPRKLIGHEVRLQVSEFGHSIMVSDAFAAELESADYLRGLRHRMLRESMREYQRLQALRVWSPELYEAEMAQRRALHRASLSAWERLCEDAHQDSIYCTCDACTYDDEDDDW